MPAIVTRKGATSPGFQAWLRLTRDGELIHKESKTFSTKAAAKNWAQGREVAQFSLHTSWEDLRRYTQSRPENLRQIIRKPSGEIEVISSPIKIMTLPCPPAIELIPPTTRASRAQIFRRLEAMEQQMRA